MQVLRVVGRLSGGEGVDLDPEGHPLLPTVLPGGELCADAVYLHTHTHTQNKHPWASVVGDMPLFIL